MGDCPVDRCAGVLVKPVLVAMLILLARWASGAPLTPELLLDRWYPDEVAAVIEAGNRHLAASKRDDREYFGAILRDDSGRHWLSVARGRSGRDRFEMAVRPPPGMQVRAFWHTHGRAGSRRELFSGPDADLVRSAARPLYLITPRGRVRVLRPDMTGPRGDFARRSLGSDPIALAGEPVAGSGDGVRRT